MPPFPRRSAYHPSVPFQPHNHMRIRAQATGIGCRRRESSRAKIGQWQRSRGDADLAKCVCFLPCLGIAVQRPLLASNMLDALRRSFPRRPVSEIASSASTSYARR
nr:unnamed protein product [Digitaria exilis]